MHIRSRDWTPFWVSGATGTAGTAVISGMVVVLFDALFINA
ncbi:hypothetical protein HMPREF3192_00522 [Atopobium deltae]|uniref:Uncharacterized protein n=1 Tax=Atopobium deltae TaxID=1393034 RepID=A0A133XW33_9ACTN|nr:hypothetical protein HMPREF3192_00522 [Atopobium deltae]